jgi:RNA polymerase sigma factor (sigma-70 family)
VNLLEVVKRICDGDLRAWNEFLPFFQEVSRRAVRSFSLSELDTDEVLQDALVALYLGRLRQFRGSNVGELVNFLKQVVRRRALDWIEKERARSGESGPRGKNGSSSVKEPAEPGDVVTKLADDECEEFLRQELERLPRGDRELYLMKCQGLKEREIAEQTGRPKGTVAAQIARLLARLRERLRDRGCLD